MCLMLIRRRLRNAWAGKILRLRLIAYIVPAIYSAAMALDNGVGLTPPMGWSTFNSWGGAWEMDVLKAAADSMVSTGLKDCGYQYINADGKDVYPNEANWWPGEPGFVDRFKSTSEYIHSKGLKFGVYMTSTSNPQATAQDLADAEIDYLKHDDWTRDPASSLWSEVSAAIAATGRPFFYSVHAGNHEHVAENVCNMWRTGVDIENEWAPVMDNLNANIWNHQFVKPGHWADPDMMVSGTISEGTALNATEERSHFSMWCMIAAPLIMGFDLSHLSEYGLSNQRYTEVIALHGNTELIAVNQDRLGKPAERLSGENAREVWMKDMHDGTKAVAFFNRTSGAADINVSKAELGWGPASTIYVRDLWVHENAGEFTDAFSKNVGVHAAEVFLMSTSPINGPVETLKKMERLDSWLKRSGHPGVLPKSTVLKVMQGNAGAVRMFDMQGRFIAADPRLVSPHTFIVRDFAKPAMTAKIMWPGR